MKNTLRRASAFAVLALLVANRAPESPVVQAVGASAAPAPAPDT